MLIDDFSQYKWIFLLFFVHSIIFFLALSAIGYFYGKIMTRKFNVFIAIATGIFLLFLVFLLQPVGFMPIYIFILPILSITIGSLRGKSVSKLQSQIASDQTSPEQQEVSTSAEQPK